MSDIVIQAENLGKKYVLAHQAASGGYVALRDELTRGARTLWRKTRNLARDGSSASGGTREEFWALKDVSFEIRRGEAVGIIGRNGAGKSTLLKVLSRITEPSAGRVTIRGRVASLLEVGTGFHPELTGRENVFLNGAVMGMTRAEIRRKFDEIVAFAEVEKFLDTPVKRYSSGMYVRLAFAVAAHLEPEILVVDEVLAVGDAAFQQKCLGKMGAVATAGRTVLFVSHNMAAIKRLCSRGILFTSGRLQMIGATADVVGCYLSEGANGAEQVAFERRPGAVAQYRSAGVADHTGTFAGHVADDREFTIRFEIEVSETVSDIYFGMILQNTEGINVLFADSRDTENSLPGRIPPGKYRMSLSIPPVLSPGRYDVVSLGIATTHPVLVLDFRETACSFEVVNHSNTQRTAARPGVLNLHLPWELSG